MRLNKIAKDFNVGVQTLMDFLEKKTGVAVDGPMANVSDEQYELLKKEFNKDKSVKEASERERLERQQTRDKIKEEMRTATATTPAKAVTPGDEALGASLKVVGSIDLNAKSPVVKKEQKPSEPVKEPAPVSEPKVEKPTPVEPEKPAAPAAVKTEMPVSEPVAPAEPEAPASKATSPEPVASQPAAPQNAASAGKSNQTQMGERSKDRLNDDPLPASARNGEVFRLRPDEPAQVKVVGTIDLNNLNQSTRPKKKTREERKREREQKADNRSQRHHGAQKVNIDEEIQKGRQNGGNNGNNGGGRDKKSHGDQNRQNRDELHQQRGGRDRRNRDMHAEVSDEDIQKSVKDTLARLGAKRDKKDVRYRKEKRNAAAERAAEAEEEAAAESRVLKLTEFVTANDLATMMKIPVVQVIQTCMSIGMMVSINQRLDADTINLVAEEFGFKTEYMSEEVEQELEQSKDRAEDLVQRPPVITVMGHVDHGKTKLLDYVRNANVVAGEAGGITQHIGAYSVCLSSGRRVTFLDTPGHEAFTAMRARGAKMTDIAIIIIAADDGVMPQTKEAINHASAAGVPIVFAINKIDKPTANPTKIKEQLAAMNYLVEDWGGKYQCQEISARDGLNVDLLLEKVLLEADMLDLKANPNREASGSVIESTLDKGRGYTATVLVQNGTLHVGDVILCGMYYGRVKALFNERGQKVDEAGPATPVQVLGLNGSPSAGDQLRVLENEQEAREIAAKRDRLHREQQLRTQTRLTLDEIGRRIAVGNFQELNLIVKGDVDGSVEALTDSLIKLSTEKIQVNVIHKAVGQISESDVVLAAASKAIIIGFQVRPSQSARRQADQQGVEIRTYSIIYDAIEEVKEAMEGMLKPELKEEVCGYLEIKTVFKITKVGAVAGCLVKEGKIHRTDKVRVIRDGIVLYAGELGSLKRFKDDVKEVGTNFECGLNITGFDNIQEGDLIEAYTEIEVKAKL